MRVPLLLASLVGVIACGSSTPAPRPDADQIITTCTTAPPFANPYVYTVDGSGNITYAGSDVNENFKITSEGGAGCTGNFDNNEGSYDISLQAVFLIQGSDEPLSGTGEYDQFSGSGVISCTTDLVVTGTFLAAAGSGSGSATGCQPAGTWTITAAVGSD
jgi:hypothetical protein